MAAQNLTIIQLSDEEIRILFREELQSFFAERKIRESSSELEEIGGINLAIEITGLAKPTIYGLCSKRKIPHLKRGKKLYFSRNELLRWLTAGKR